MNLFELNRLNVVSIDNCIGCYDDLKNKELNNFGKVKKFRKFKVTLHVLPDKITYTYCKIPNYDVYSLYNKFKKENEKLCWDIKTTIVNGDIYYHVYDKTPMKLNNVYVELDEYLTCRDAAKTILSYLNIDGCNHITLGVEYKEPIFKQLKSYLDRKFDDHVIWKDN